VGVVYGIRRVRVPFTSNLLIALITGAGTLVAMIAGRTIGHLMSLHIANLFGSAILIGLGGLIVFQELQAVSESEALPRLEINSAVPEGRLTNRVLTILKNPLSADRDFSRHIDLKEALLLGLALSLNNLVNGVAAGIAGMGPILITILVVIFSVLTLWSGMSVGYRFGSRLLGNYAGMVSGLLLIFIGIYQIFL